MAYPQTNDYLSSVAFPLPHRLSLASFSVPFSPEVAAFYSDLVDAYPLREHDSYDPAYVPAELGCDISGSILRDQSGVDRDDSARNISDQR